ncbi:hypothetical protein EPN44_15915 [bacterium]|nr:MAG: hypothetical protein EPN44_15915 [bacterium]
MKRGDHLWEVGLDSAEGRIYDTLVVRADPERDRALFDLRAELESALPTELYVVPPPTWLHLTLSGVPQEERFNPTGALTRAVVKLDFRTATAYSLRIEPSEQEPLAQLAAGFGRRGSYGPRYGVTVAYALADIGVDALAGHAYTLQDLIQRYRPTLDAVNIEHRRAPADGSFTFRTIASWVATS